MPPADILQLSTHKHASGFLPCGNCYLFQRRHMGYFRFPLGLVGVLVVACSDPAGPNLNGPLLFTAQVDGTAWTPNNGANTEVYLTPEGNFLLRAIRRDTLFRAVDGIAVVGIQVRGPGRYALTSDWDRDYGLYATYDPVNSTHTLFLSTPPNTGEIEITQIDAATRRIAGRFNFEAQQVDEVRRVSIQGAFRVVYEPAFP